MESDTPVYNTPEGQELVKAILAEQGIIAHDFQMQGVLIILDDRTLVATMATGSGKTGFFAFSMLAMLAISKNPSLALKGKTFPKDPAMVVVVPTKALQEDMCNNLRNRYGLDAVIINGDTATKELWHSCQKLHSIILIGPEQMTKSEFRELLDSKAFTARVCRLGIDEVHLICSWGESRLRSDFLQLGHIRSRFPRFSHNNPIPLIVTSATIREGHPMTTICNTLGLVWGQFHLLRRSNLRRDMQIIVRVLTSGPANVSFPELDWILDSGRNTVIFCKTIGFGFRVGAYLWRKGITKGIKDLPSKLRLFNSLNSNKFNQETLGFLNTDPSTPRIIISTDVLSVGWDSPNTEDVVVLGDPDTLDDLLQKWGRAGRDHSKVPDPRAFLYHTRTAIATAQTVMNSQDVQKAAATSMDISMAEFHVALCKSGAIDVLYDNPATDIPCVCENCKDKVVPTWGSCNCSGCMPEAPIPTWKKPSKPRAKRNQGISKAMLELALRRFTPIRQKIFDADPMKNVWLPPEYYLPDEDINTLAKHPAPHFITAIP
ncbi:P-loop containing nucleoside triphosphate hydrolase protein [Coprinellus micaceus]|uniref:DNA 3'-5' helicase n=1 Tax=Coprinellus micaceus TaxID=71717 RepID=A0A4Y7SKT4_COPMI|nr:P-loop containing nucleoside triphosphate hydrolase protein [Coprinellus micaceus]